MDAAEHHEILGLFPKEREAVLSWLNRVAMAYGSSPREISKYLGVPIRSLRETSIVPFTVEKLLDVTGYSRGHFALNELVTKHIPSLVLPEHYYLRRLRGGAIKFRFCPKCLLYDEVPIFKVDWCLDFVRYCLHHKCLLESRCPHCNSDVCLPYDVYSGKRLRFDIVSLAQCSTCGNLLTAVDEVPMRVVGIGERGEFRLNSVRNGMAVMASLVCGYGIDRLTKKRFDLRFVGSILRRGLAPNAYLKIDPAYYRKYSEGIPIDGEETDSYWIEYSERRRSRVLAVLEQWDLTPEEIGLLLDAIGTRSIDWLYIVEIHDHLKKIYGDTLTVNSWVTRPNLNFSGDRPLEYILKNGSVGLYQISRYLSDFNCSEHPGSVRRVN